MQERLYQGQFDEFLEFICHQEVTPEGFAGLDFPIQENAYKRVLNEQPQELGRFVREVSDRVQVSSPEAAAAYFQQHIFTPFNQFDQEEIWSLLLDAKNRITHTAMIYRGTVNSVTIRPAELFKEAVRHNSSAIILSHNHPSGNPEPSPRI